MKIEVTDFYRFYVPGVMKIDKNQSVWFLRIFMYPGSWKSMKIGVTDFYRFYVPGVMKIDENRSVWFLWIFMKIDENWSDIETRSTMGSDYWAAYVGGGKIKTDGPKRQTWTNIITH